MVKTRTGGASDQGSGLASRSPLARAGERGGGNAELLHVCLLSGRSFKVVQGRMGGIELGARTLGKIDGNKVSRALRATPCED
jgi:hypothetical protein